jgi:hypothetical protein
MKSFFEKADRIFVQDPRYLDVSMADHIKHKVRVVRSAIETGYRLERFDSRQGCCLIADFSYPPALDGVIWFLKKVLPILKAQKSIIKFTIFGDNIPRPICKLCEDHVDLINLRVTSHDYLDICSYRVAIIPLRFGNPYKTAVASIFARGLPCVITPIVSAGLDLPRSLLGLVADDESEMARLIQLYFIDRHSSEKVSKLEQTFSNKFFSRKRLLNDLRGALADLM